MSKSVNEVLLIGNAGKDPEIRQVSDTEVAQFSLATTQGGFKKQDGTEVPERTQWHNIVAWRGLAKLAKFIHKGDKVVVKGMIDYREYEKDGTKHYVTDIVATDIILTTKAEGGRPPLEAKDIPPQAGSQPLPSNAPFPPQVDSNGQPVNDDMPF